MDFVNQSVNSEVLCIVAVSAVLLTSSVSPLKLAFSVALSSIWVSVVVYLKVLCLFPSAATVISFSSGMIIVFCYCAVYAGFENNSHPNLTLLAAGLITVASSSWNSGTLSSFSLSLESIIITPIVWTAIILIVLALMAINNSLFSPTNTLLASY